MLTQMFHQRHQRNRQTNAKTPDSKIHPRKESATSKLEDYQHLNSIINTCIFDQQKIHSESRNYSRNFALHTTTNSSTFSRWNKKKKSNDNTIDPRTNKIQDTVDPRIFASDIRPALPLREKITIILVGAGVVTAVVSICSEISPGPRCL